MSGPRPSLETRASGVRVTVPKPGQDRRGGDQYLVDLVNEAERSLRRSPRWRAGKALEDHRDTCDCPSALAGCWERRAWPTSYRLGSRSGIPAVGGRWPR